MATGGITKTVTYHVFVRKVNGHFAATVVGFPECSVEAPSRDEAITRAREAVGRFVSEGELVKIEVESPTAARSLQDFAPLEAGALDSATVPEGIMASGGSSPDSMET